jgi:hypothetical protein
LEQRAFSRKYLRIKPVTPVFGTIRIMRVGHRQTISGRAEVRIIDISPGGARFATALKFPVDPEVVLQLMVMLEGTSYCMEGSIVNRSGSGNRGFEYGFRFAKPEPRLKSVLMPIFARSVNMYNRQIIVIRPNDLTGR